MVCVKTQQQKCIVKIHFGASEITIFYTSHKINYFSQNVACEHKISGFTLEIKLEFFEILKCGVLIVHLHQ